MIFRGKYGLIIYQQIFAYIQGGNVHNNIDDDISASLRGVFIQEANHGVFHWEGSNSHEWA